MEKFNRKICVCVHEVCHDTSSGYGVVDGNVKKVVALQVEGCLEIQGEVLWISGERWCVVINVWRVVWIAEQMGIITDIISINLVISPRDCQGGEASQLSWNTPSKKLWYFGSVNAYLITKDKTGQERHALKFVLQMRAKYLNNVLYNRYSGAV